MLSENNKENIKSDTNNTHLNEYDKVFMELETLQKQFDRMKEKRKNSVNLQKLKRQNELRNELKIKMNYNRSTFVFERKKNLEEEKTKEKLLLSQKKKRKREERLKMLTKYGKNNLIKNFTLNNNIAGLNLETYTNNSYEKRREQVLQNKKFIENEKKINKNRVLFEKENKYKSNISLKPEVLRSNSFPSSYSYRDIHSLSHNKNNNTKTPLQSINQNILKPKKIDNSNRSFGFMRPTLAQYMNNKDLSRMTF